MNENCLLVKADSAAQKQQFKEVCAAQGVTMRKAVCLLMDGMISNKIVIEQRARRVRK
ncbi:MAG: hypothetical protein KAJ19_12915 [Gammaproteobacteria bacterium]|nr:hypothetical protein [Gammaproteobacteria bacterium]